MGWKPIRKARKQLSREQGTIIKDWGGRIPVALIYPNSYYAGMSNLGIHAIYKLLNNHSEVVCERVFWEIGTHNESQPPLSLESQRPLSDFTVLAFSVSYELDFFNVVQILKSSGVPLYASDRDERHPLVIAGGPCITANPIPLSPICDCLCIGEAESILPIMIPLLSEGISGRRDELLKELTSIPGNYVPLAHSGTPVARQWIKNLDDFPTNSTILTPDTELGNLYLVEVERGCSWGCRFCLVNKTFCPVRYRSIDKLITQAKLGLERRKRIGLVGPAVSDHPQIEGLLTKLRQMGAGISISSLRVKPLPYLVLKKIAEGGARTVTLAPEAGSQRLRLIIRKNISRDDILETISEVAKVGIKQIKLYFMIGLPSESDEDIAETINLVISGKNIIDKQQTGCRLNLSVSPFIPKAGTPFQWLPMAKLSILNHRLSLLKDNLVPKGIKIKSESPAWSQVQGVLARGDNKLAQVLADIEGISLSNWHRAVEKYHVDIDYYAHQRWDTEKELPWVMIDLGTKSEQLKLEFNRALS